MSNIGIEALLDLRRKAEAATKGPWELRHSRYNSYSEKLKPYVAGPSEIIHGGDGIAQPERLNDRTFAEDEANMAYIAAASPDIIIAMIDLILEVHEKLSKEKE